MELDFGLGKIRSWKTGDAPALVRHADNRKIWRNVRDRFPHPYTQKDAEDWLALAVAQNPETAFALDIDGEAAGGIGLLLQEDVYRLSAEMGYWLGEAFWNRGIMSAAVQSFADYAFAEFELRRLYAQVFEWNPASCRVLEKAGFTREARLRRNIIKDGTLMDSFLYARIKDDPPRPGVVAVP